jgi:hypothetical protein
MIFLVRISFFRQMFIAFALIVFGWLLLSNALRMHSGVINVSGMLIAVVCWWLAYRAIRAGFWVLNAHARVTFGRN